MPELPEVETIVNDLNLKVKNLKIIDIWTDWPKYFSAKGGPASGGKFYEDEKSFKKRVVGKKIIKVKRRGKNILMELSDDHMLLIHQKMSGHMLYGKWMKRQNFKGALEERWEKEKWIPDPPEGNLIDPKNKFIRLIFFLDNGKMLALSDLRRFAKVLIGKKKDILNLKEIKNLGPEPLEKEFTFKKFMERVELKKGKIKPVLLDQYFIVGVGNIYADEILYDAKIHPLSRIEKLKTVQLKVLYKSMRKILKSAVKARGSSIDDFRDASGEMGGYAKKLKVFQQTGKKCPKGHIVEKMKLVGRGTHFCPMEQKLYT